MRGEMMTEQEVIKNCRKPIEDWIGRAYNAGYDSGYEKGIEEVSRLRSECFREVGERDAEYPDGWKDYTPFYGWCNLCKRPHSGRWAHIWDYCPWCGAKINHKAQEPYPTGMYIKTEET